MKLLVEITYRAVNKSRGVAEKVAFITVTFAVLAIIVSMSVAAGFRQELTSVLLDSEGDYWLECRDSTLGEHGTQKIDTALIETLSKLPVNKVEPRSYSPAIILADDGAIPLEIRSLDRIKGKGVSISSQLASRLSVSEGDTIYMLHSLKLPFSFPVVVDSLYECNITELSGSIAYASFSTVSSLKGVEDDYIDGYVIWGGDLDSVANMIFSKNLWMYDAQERFSGIFDWLDVIDGNVWLVVIIMIIVATINMMAASLSMILENTKTIAILKSLGMPISNIRYGIMMRGLIISLKGALLGFFLAVGLCLLQQYFDVITLPEADYMVDSVPICLNIPADLLAMMLSVIAISIMSLFVTSVINRIKVDKIIRYE